MASTEATAELHKLGGLEVALKIVLNEEQENEIRETAALAIATASRADDKICVDLFSRDQKAFRNIVELLWDDNVNVSKNCLRFLHNCTFMDFDSKISRKLSLRALVARFIQGTDWISSLLSILKSDPCAKKKTSAS